MMRRTYRGGAGEGVASLSKEEKMLYQKAKPRSDEIMAKHTGMPDLDSIPEASWGTAAPGVTEENATDIRRKRLIYRSKQRGWLEVDLLLGTWASEHVPRLEAEELDEFEAFVNLETIDIYNIITLRTDQVPEQFKTSAGGGVVERIQAWARNNPLGKADPEKYRAVKADAKLI
jgi:succinate dehydrogenase assembly factor 2